MSDSDSQASRTSRVASWGWISFELLLAASQVFGFSMVLLAGYFFQTIAPGISWGDGSQGGHNLHALLMTVGMVFFQGEALLSYRLYRYDVKILSKFIHVVFHSLCIGLFTTAIVAMVLDKNKSGQTHFFSAHSWIGVGVMFVYLLQFAFGLINYAFPGVSLKTKQDFMPIHRLIGCLSFGASVAQVLIGNVEFITFKAGGGALSCYFGLACPDSIGVIFNLNVLCVLLYGLTVLVIVIKPSWRREKTPDEME